MSPSTAERDVLFKTFGRAWFKRDAELLLQDYANKKLVTGTVIRLPLVYGPGGKGNVEKMIDAIDKGFFVRIGDGKSFRSMIHVDNAVLACLSAGNRPSKHFRTFIATDRQNYSVEQLCTHISESLGKRPPLKIPKTIARMLAKVGDHAQTWTGKRLPFNSDTLNKLTNTYTFDSQKISDELGFMPEHSLETSMKPIVDHWRSTRS